MYSVTIQVGREMYSVNIQVGREVYSVNPQEAEQLKLLRRLDVNYYTQAIKQADEDYLTTLVLEVSPVFSNLVLEVSPVY